MILEDKPSPQDLVLQHRRLEPYDPVKAHDYYMRTRKLKGRPDKTDAVAQFSPTLSRILQEKQTIVDAGRNFIARFFH